MPAGRPWDYPPGDPRRNAFEFGRLGNVYGSAASPGGGAGGSGLGSFSPFEKARRSSIPSLAETAERNYAVGSENPMGDADISGWEGSEAEVGTADLSTKEGVQAFLGEQDDDLSLDPEIEEITQRIASLRQRHGERFDSLLDTILGGYSPSGAALGAGGGGYGF